MHSLYCPTRFVTEDEAQIEFAKVLNEQLLLDGRKAPVITIGQGWNVDEMMLKQ
jgi:hypothetical protein